jgi:hypothetical protein
MKQFLQVAMLCAGAVTLSACESDSGNILEIDATGELFGLVYVDRDANGRPDTQVDLPAEGVSVALLRPSSDDVIARVTTDATGAYFFRSVPVGRYRLDVEETSLGDTLSLASIDSATITVVAGDTSTAVIALGYPQIPIAELGSIPVGRRVSIQGVALNAYTSYGDSTLHVADTSGVLRLLRVAPAPVQAGDTVRLVGTVVMANSTVTMADATVFRRESAPLTRVPVLLTTAAAATAGSGDLEFDLIRIDSATIVSTQALPGNEAQINVDDGSGLLSVILEPTGQFGSQPNLIPGALLDATGLLVPNTTGTGWILKPRNAQDISPTIRRVTIAEARTLRDGDPVQIEGLALNSSSAFGNGNVHMVDGTGSLRVVQVPTNAIAQADSVRFIGHIRIIEGHTILAMFNQTVLLQNRTLPAPTVVTTLTASTANSGTLDAALVHVDSATVTATGNAGGFFVEINDGSGPVVVRPGGQINTSGLVVGANVRMTGVLVPTSGSSSWALRPRIPADIQVIN